MMRGTISCIKKGALIALLVCCCACSANIDPERQYTGSTLPLRVGVRFEQNRVAYDAGEDANSRLGPAVVQNLRTWQLFQELRGPNAAPLDSELVLSITGRLDRQDGANVAKRVFIASTLFLGSAFVRYRSDFSHTIEAQLLRRGELIGQYSVSVKTEVATAYAPAPGPLTEKDLAQTERVHAGRMAAALAEAIAKDRSNLVQ